MKTIVVSIVVLVILGLVVATTVGDGLTAAMHRLLP